MRKSISNDLSRILLNQTTFLLSKSFHIRKIVMNVFVRKFRFQKSDVEFQNENENRTKFNRIVSQSIFNLRIINSYQIDATIE